PRALAERDRMAHDRPDLIEPCPLQSKQVHPDRQDWLINDVQERVLDQLASSGLPRDIIGEWQHPAIGRSALNRRDHFREGRVGTRLMVGKEAQASLMRECAVGALVSDDHEIWARRPFMSDA